MAYTPPAGNATNFTFVNGGYSPPGGSAVPFVFGGSTPPPPPGAAALPLGITRARLDQDDWYPQLRRPLAIPPAAAVTGIPPFRRPQTLVGLEEWFPRVRRRCGPIFTLDDDDVMVTLLF